MASSIVPADSPVPAIPRTNKLIINDINAAAFLLNPTTKNISFDIETETTPPPDSDWTKAFGLSYVTDITHIAFYVTNYPPVVFFVPPVKGSQLQPNYRISPQEQDIIEFIRKVLSRENVRIIGHNVVFDLRSACGHYEIPLHPKVQVWDTLAMALRLAQGEESDGAKRGDLALLAQAEKWQISTNYFSADDSAFYRSMKDYRTDFSKVATALREEVQAALTNVTPLSQGALFRYIKLIDAPLYSTAELLLNSPDTPDSIKSDIGQRVAMLVIACYVALDTVITMRLFDHQFNFVQTVREKDVAYPGGFKFPHWPELPDIVRLEQQVSRESAIQAIRGVRVDIPYIDSRIQEAEIELRITLEAIAEMPDPTTRTFTAANALPVGETSAIVERTAEQQFMLYATIAYWYATAMAALGEGKYSTPTQWHYFSPLELTANDVWFWEGFMDRPTNEDEQQRWDTLVNVLSTLRPSLSRAAVLRHLQPLVGLFETFPSFEFWLARVSTPTPYHEPYWTFFMGLKAAWFTHLITSKTEITVDEMLTKRTWKPYFLFVVCQLPLPSTEEIRFNPTLVTGGFSKYMELLKEDGHDMDEVDWTKVAALTNTFSTGTEAVDYYLEQLLASEEEDTGANKAATAYREAMLLDAFIKRSREFKLHASRDGRIHPLIARLARTGRYTSTNMNLQNLDMKRYAGYLIADPGFTLGEFDYSNAENIAGAASAADDVLMEAALSSDWHKEMTLAYWPEKAKALLAADDMVGFQALRTMSKRVTFAEAYGSGVNKLMVVTRMSREEIEELLAKKKQRFPRLYATKEEAAKAVDERLQRGYFPAFTKTWAKTRVIVPVYTHQDKVKASGYKAWNYIQQGAIAEIVARATVTISQVLREKGYKSRIAFNVHDSLIVELAHDEYHEVAELVCRLMSEAAPESFCNRTIPPAVFVTEIGPENARKWGYRWNAEYPFPLDEFINKWGVHKLPDSVLALPVKERKAPTWYGDLNAGWTVEAAKLAAKLNMMQTAPTDLKVGELGDGKKWQQVAALFRQSRQAFTEFRAVESMLAALLSLRELSYVDARGQIQTVKGLTFEEFMTLAEALQHRGQLTDTEFFPQIMQGINTVLGGIDSLVALFKLAEDFKDDSPTNA